MIVIADVRLTILGADFLVHYKLIVDIRARWLIDEITNLSVSTVIVNSKLQSVKSVDVN